MSFGRLWRYDEKFPSTIKVAREFGIDTAEMNIDQFLGPDDDWNHIRSVAVYYEANVARAQAQKVWSQSAVHTLYKEGNIRRARYGFKEGETRVGNEIGLTKRIARRIIGGER